MRVRLLLNIVKHKTNEVIIVKLMIFKKKTTKILNISCFHKKKRLQNYKVDLECRFTSRNVNNLRQKQNEN